MRFGKLVSAALIGASLMTGTVFASNMTFSDVPADSVYYEAVEFVSSQGVACGTGGGVFSVDAPITTRQLAVMIARALDWDVAQDSPFGDREVQACFNRGVFSVEMASTPDTQVTMGTLYHVLFQAFDVDIYDPTLYGYEYQTPADTAVSAAKYFGILPDTAKSETISVRGDAAYAVWKLMTGTYALPEPELVQAVTIDNPNDVSLNSYLVELDKIPDELLNRFIESGWTYSLDVSTLSEYMETYGTGSVVGLCSYENKTITVANPGTTIHEFGHFLDYAQGWASDELEHEYRNASSFLREYAMTNVHEYYADYFAYYLSKYDNADAVEKMKTLTPDTYAQFEAMRAAGWVLD